MVLKVNLDLLKLRMSILADAGNLANYYAGMAYLNTGKYNEAIDYLNKFKSDDIVKWFGNWCNWRRLCRRQ
jgi:hypothetical protein